MTGREPQQTPDLAQCDLLEERLTELLCEDPVDLEGFLQRDEHLRQCGACRQVVEALFSATQISACPTPVVTAALAQVAASRSRVRRIGLAVAMGAAAMALISAIVFFSSPKTTKTTNLHEGSPLVLRSSPFQENAGTILVAGENTKALQDSLFATADKSLEIGLQAGSSLQVPRLDGQGTDLVLHSGLVAIALDPDRHLPLAMTVGAARIRVTGTILFANAALGQVGVLEGSIEVHVEDTPPIRVQAGQKLDLATLRLTSLDEDTANRVHRLLGKAPRANPLSMDSARDTAHNQDKADHQELVAAAEPKTMEIDTTHLSSSQAPVRHRSRSPNDSSAKTSKSSSSAQRLKGSYLADARRCRAGRDWNCAARNYELAISALPGSHEALVALVSLAELELEQLGRPGAALGHYNNYLSSSPQGALAPEAMHGRCRALSALGRPAEEKACLEKFVKTYPESPYARKAQGHLD
jgi:TolA-binding protein